MVHYPPGRLPFPVVLVVVVGVPGVRGDRGPLVVVPVLHPYRHPVLVVPVVFRSVVDVVGVSARRVDTLQHNRHPPQLREQHHPAVLLLQTLPLFVRLGGLSVRPLPVRPAPGGRHLDPPYLIQVHRQFRLRPVVLPRTHLQLQLLPWTVKRLRSRFLGDLPSQVTGLAVTVVVVAQTMSIHLVLPQPRRVPTGGRVVVPTVARQRVVGVVFLLRHLPTVLPGQLQVRLQDTRPAPPCRAQ